MDGEPREAEDGRWLSGGWVREDVFGIIRPPTYSPHGLIVTKHAGDGSVRLALVTNNDHEADGA